MNPIKRFKDWYKEETAKSTLKIPSACCLSSVGPDGYPNARFVSLKDIVDNKFVVTGPVNSRKGQELLKNPKASLTFWWTETERQVRVQGDAIIIEDDLADIYFKTRNRESQIVSHVSKQGEETFDINQLQTLFDSQISKFENEEISRPKDWSGFYIVPKRIEFMAFNNSRFHFRELFIHENSNWTSKILQP